MTRKENKQRTKRKWDSKIFEQDFARIILKNLVEKKQGYDLRPPPNDLDDNVDRTGRAIQKSLPKIKG